jgi:hypothetical protein
MGATRFLGQAKAPPPRGEAGLHITSDCCPAWLPPGSFTRQCLVHSLQILDDVRSAGRLINELEPDQQTVPPPFGGGWAHSGVVPCFLRWLVRPRDVRARSREEHARCRTQTPGDTQLDHCDERQGEFCATRRLCQANQTLSFLQVVPAPVSLRSLIFGAGRVRRICGADKRRKAQCS